MLPYGFHTIAQHSITSALVKCPHCECMCHPDAMITVDRAGWGVVWQGCMPCLIAAGRVLQERPSLVVQIGRLHLLLDKARTAITERLTEAEIDAVCVEIDAALKG